MKLVQACLSAWKVREIHFDSRGGPVKLVQAGLVPRRYVKAILNPIRVL